VLLPAPASREMKDISFPLPASIGFVGNGKLKTHRPLFLIKKNTAFKAVSLIIPDFVQLALH